MQTFTGYEYIMIDVANQMGLDKETWDIRIAWTKKNNSKLEKMRSYAAEPILYMKAVKALRDAENHKPTGYIMGLDATASGLQIMAALIGCHITAANVNLVDTGKRQDAYANVGTRMHMDREIVKYPVMTTFYNSIKQPKEVFGDNTPELKLFYETLEELFPGAMEVLFDIQGCWDPTALEHAWTLPDGHYAYVKVTGSEDKKIEVDELNHATFTHRAYINKPEEKGKSLPANVIHSIDAWIVREMLRRAQLQGFELLSIHDSFWCSPNYMNNVRQNYVDILVELANSNLLGDLLGEITGGTTKYTKRSNNLANKIKLSNYALS